MKSAWVLAELRPSWERVSSAPSLATASKFPRAYDSAAWDLLPNGIEFVSASLHNAVARAETALGNDSAAIEHLHDLIANIALPRR